MKRALLSLLLALALGSCAHMDAAGEVTYASDAAKNFQLGQEALDSGRYLDAVKYFDHVRYKYPYSAQAALADLAIGDTRYAEDKYPEAIEGYRSFLKLHPNHPKADYAQFRIAESFYKDMPSDFFLFPRSTEKDQSAVRDARIALEEFLRLYPTSSHRAEADKLLVDVRHRLAAHELYVADFYIHRKKWSAATGRLNRLLEEFPGTGLDAEALYKLGSAYVELGDKQKARETLERLVQTFPNDKYRAEAEKLLKRTI